jgi:hypothetical protein
MRERGEEVEEEEEGKMLNRECDLHGKILA